MDDYGFVCLLPPLIAIVLALATKQTIPSLFCAIWVGATIVNGYNPLTGLTGVFTDYMIPSIASSYNAGMLILVTMAGGFAHMLKVTGAAEAFSKAITRKIDNPKKAQIVTWFSAFVFSYTEPCLILGTIMRPITDAARVSRAKLAYILDSMGCNLAAFSPISSYGPFITGLIATQLLAANVPGNEWSIYIHMFPFNLYGAFAMLTVLFVALTNFNIGPMYREEKRARETGKLLADGVEPLIPEVESKIPDGYHLTMKNFLVPMAALFISIFATIFWTGDLSTNGLLGSFVNGNITLAITMGFFGGSIAAGAVGILTGLFKFNHSVNSFVQGMSNLIMVPFILILAWSVGSITSTMGVGLYLSGIVQTHLTSGMVPAMIFLLGSIISFATGSSWGVWSIMMPIAIPMALTFHLPLPFVIGAVIGGGLFGDQCSPISDTTIMSSTGASCNLIVHISTQLIYGVTVGISAFCGFLFGGLTGQYYLSIVVAGMILLAALFMLSRYTKRKNQKKLAHIS